MHKYSDLYNFIDFAKGNRKYPENTANGLKSALRIFEKELNIDELSSIDLVEENIEEIFINVVGKNKDKGIGSLNTYKARVLKVIKDYQKYGVNPSKIQSWVIKYHKIDRPDKIIDKKETALSSYTNTPVHKIELSLTGNNKAIITIPKNINTREIKAIKDILDSLSPER